MLSKILGSSRNGFVPFKATVYSHSDYLEADLATAGAELDIVVMSRHDINWISVFRGIPCSFHKRMSGYFSQFLPPVAKI
jgi:hypothetical protein